MVKVYPAIRVHVERQTKRNRAAERHDDLMPECHVMRVLSSSIMDRWCLALIIGMVTCH